MRLARTLYPNAASCSHVCSKCLPAKVLLYAFIALACIVNVIKICLSNRHESIPSERCDIIWQCKVDRYEKYIHELERAENARLESIAGWNGINAYDMYEPEWNCELEERVGPNKINVGDGPKFVCGPDFLNTKEICTVYSIGSAYDFQFEEGLHQKSSNCIFHTFDGTLNLTERPLPNGLRENQIFFHNWNIGISSSVSFDGVITKSLEDVLIELDHSNRTIDIFKIDCEGCEYLVLDNLSELVMSGVVRIDQIQVEIHGSRADQIQALFQKLRKAGFAIFHKERNHWGCNGYHCVEYSLISLRKARNVLELGYC